MADFDDTVDALWCSCSQRLFNFIRLSVRFNFIRLSVRFNLIRLSVRFKFIRLSVRFNFIRLSVRFNFIRLSVRFNFIRLSVRFNLLTLSVPKYGYCRNALCVRYIFLSIHSLSLVRLTKYHVQMFYDRI
jgi:hypothetical protein